MSWNEHIQNGKSSNSYVMGQEDALENYLLIMEEKDLEQPFPMTSKRAKYCSCLYKNQACSLAGCR